jgi:hypothetical protein
MEGDIWDRINNQCYLLLIGVENLWRKVESGQRHAWANFGQYVLTNVFKVIQGAAALTFCDKKWVTKTSLAKTGTYLCCALQVIRKRKDRC